MPELGRLIAKGRAADVFEYGATSDGLVLRRYRSAHSTLYEAAVMQHVAAHGYPVPHVMATQGTDLVMERLDGPTMLADFAKRPWVLFQHTATLAGLIKQLHAIPAPDWLEDKHGGTGNDFVHLDLHPDNVMVTSRGPVVIDWSNAGRGDGDAEVADLWLIMACAAVPGKVLDRMLAAVGRRLLVASLMRRFDLDAVRSKLAFALSFRARDRNMSDREITKMHRLVERKGR